MLLWKGINEFLKQNKGRYNYMIGPVSISGEFSNLSKDLLVAYIRHNHFDKALSKMVKPRKKFKYFYHEDDKKLLLDKHMDDIKLLDKNYENNNLNDEINNLNIKINSLYTRINDISERINYNSISKFIDEKFVIFQTQYNLHINNRINELTPQFDKIVYNNNNIYENLSKINQNINELKNINEDIYENINKINENSLKKNNEIDNKLIEIEKNLEKNLVTIDLTKTETITKFDEDIKIQKSCFTFPNIF
jgi:chromosome segregation ATPase